MCRYCYKGQSTDTFEIGFKIHDKAYEVTYSFNKLEEQLLKYLKVAPIERRKEINAYHKEVIRMRKKFNRYYNSFLTENK